MILIALLIAAATPEPPRAFVNRVIAYEERSDTTMRDEAFLAFFTPRFRAAIVKDRSGPELNVIDSDFLCRCQTGVATMRILALHGSKSAAVAKVESRSVGANPPVVATWHLQRDGQGWRISDVDTAQGRSLLSALEHG